MIPPDPGSSDSIDPSATPGEPVTTADPAASADPAAPARPGAGTFTIEGRSAPGLFVVGWLATLIGLVAIGVSVLGGGSTAAAILLFVGLAFLSVGIVAGAGGQGIERRTRGDEGYRGPSPFLVFAASVPVSLFAVFAFAIPLTIGGIEVDSPIGRLASVVIQALVYIGLIRLLVVDVGALSWTDMGLRGFDRRALDELAIGALCAAPVIFATVIVAGLLYQIFPVTPVSPLPPAGETLGFVINLVAGAIVAPIGEELLFRAFATTAWARTIGDRRALVRGALFFAVVHVLTVIGASLGEALALMVVGFVARIPVAFALGWLFLERKSIWAPIGLHATFNAILLIFAEIAARNGLVPG